MTVCDRSKSVALGDRISTGINFKILVYQVFINCLILMIIKPINKVIKRIKI